MTPEERLAALEELASLKAQVGQSSSLGEPVPYKPELGISNLGGMWSMEEPTTYDLYPGKKADAASGIDIYGSPALDKSVFLKAGLAGNTEEKTNFYKQHLDKAYGRDVEMRTSPNNPDRILFKSPSTGRWTPVEKYGMGLEDTASVAQGVVETAGAVGGGILGSALPGGGTISGGAVGAGAAATAAEGGKRKLAEVLGVIPKQPENAIAHNALQHGVNMGATEVAGGALFGAAKFIKGALRGYKVPITSEEAYSILQKTKKYDDAVSAINDTPTMVELRRKRAEELGVNPDDYKLNFRADQLGVSDKAALQVGRAMQDPDARILFDKQERTNWDILGMYMDSLGAGFQRSPKSPSPGRVAQQALEQKRKSMVDPAAQQAARAQAQQELAEGKIPSAYLDDGETGNAIRGQWAQMEQESNQKVRDAYSQFENSVGIDPDTNLTPMHRIPVTGELTSFQKGLEALSRAGIIKEQDVPLSKLGVTLPKTRPGEAALARAPEEAKLDLGSVHDAIKRLREADRKQWLNQTDIGLTGGERSRLENILVDMRNGYLKEQDPKAFELLDAAEKEAKSHADTFRRGFVSKFLKSDGSNGYTISDPEVVDAIIKDRNRAASSQMAELSAGNPILMDELRNVAFASYRREVMADGTVDLAKHKQFMQDKWETIAPFFKKEDRNLIRQAGGMAAAVIKSNQELEAANAKWSTLLGGRLARAGKWNPEAMTKVVFDKGKTSMGSMGVAELKSAIKTYTGEEGLRNWQFGVQDELRHRLTKNGDLNIQALNDMLSTENIKPIEIALGKDYVASLKKLQWALSVQKVPALSAGNLELASGSPRIRKGLMAFEGPLSKGSRWISFARGERQSATAHAIYDAFTDPEKLKYWAGYSEKEARKKMGVVTGAALFNLTREDQVRE